MQHGESAQQGEAEAEESDAGCCAYGCLASACLFGPAVALPITQRATWDVLYAGPLLWLVASAILLALWIKLVDYSISGFLHGTIYLFVIVSLGAQILLALAALLGHVLR